jgi:hypothetical protein
MHLPYSDSHKQIHRNPIPNVNVIAIIIGARVRGRLPLTTFAAKPIYDIIEMMMSGRFEDLADDMHTI